MRYTLAFLPAVLFLWGIPSAHADQLALDEWEPAAGDIFIVDTKENIGYLRHLNGDYAETKVATGQKRTVKYIGRTYYAATPEAWWVVKSTTLQPDRNTFGPSGLFLRLYRKGKESTSYGIHSYKDIDAVLEGETKDRYISMGCVLVSDDVLLKLLKTYELNDKGLQVITRNGIEKELYLEE